MRKIFLILLAMSLALALVACGDASGDENVVGTDSDTEPAGTVYCAVIIRDPCSDEVKAASELLKSAIESSSGKSAGVFGDEDTTVSAEIEILLGNTRRDESKAISVTEKNYVIDRTGEKIIIKGRTDADLADAVEYFIENYVSESGVTLARGDGYEYTYVYPTLLADGVDLKGYTFVNKAEIRADVYATASAEMLALYGYCFSVSDVETGSEKEIVVEIDPSIGENRYRSGFDGEKLYLTGSDRTAATVALSNFISKLPLSAEEGDIVELSAEDEGETLPLYTESNTNMHFEVSTDKDALSYKVGEEIVFDIELKSGEDTVAVPLFYWTIKCENGETTSGYSAGGCGSLRLKTSLSAPGFAYVSVKACDEMGAPIEAIPACGAGACADRSEILVSASEPSDWESFWEGQLERLDAVAPVASEMEEVSARDGYYTYDIKINCPGDESYTDETYSAIFVSVPKKAESESLKISVTFMGAGVRSTETHLGYSEDAICVSVNGHSIPSYMGEDYYKKLEADLGSYTFIKPEDTEPSEVFYSYMVMRDLQALRFVKSYFGPDGEDLWDGETIEVKGMSEGGYQALFTAALDPDVTLCRADVPAICDKQGVYNGRMSSYGPAYASMLYYDACFFARRIKCPVTVMVGLGDTVCCPSGITAMYNELVCDKQITYVQNMGHAYPTDGWNQQTLEFGESEK